MILETQMLIPTEKLKLEKMVFYYIFVHVYVLGVCGTSLWCSLNLCMKVFSSMLTFLKKTSEMRVLENIFFGNCFFSYQSFIGIWEKTLWLA